MGIIKKLTLRNLQLKRKRTIVTIIGIILSGAMIMGVGSIAASFQDFFLRSAIQSDAIIMLPLMWRWTRWRLLSGSGCGGGDVKPHQRFCPFTAGTEGHKPC